MAKYALQCSYKRCGISRLRRHFVYRMNDALGVSHVTHGPTYLSGRKMEFPVTPM